LWWKAIEGKLLSEEKLHREKEIKKYVQKRCEMIVDEQKKMLRSLLERPFNKVVLDRILIKENDEYELISEPNEVLSKTNKHFKEQFRRRNPRLDLLNEEWRSIYQPLSGIQEEWYEPVLLPVELEEWLLMLNEVRTNSAPGVSNITYELIKQADLRVHTAFKNFANICLVQGNIPNKWKVAQIYTIPKGKIGVLS